jgi:proline iminopeptidase
MFGVEEYSIDGTLKGYDGKEILKMIQVPVLYIPGMMQHLRLLKKI